MSWWGGEKWILKKVRRGNGGNGSETTKERKRSNAYWQLWASIVNSLIFSFFLSSAAFLPPFSYFFSFLFFFLLSFAIASYCSISPPFFCCSPVSVLSLFSASLPFLLSLFYCSLFLLIISFLFFSLFLCCTLLLFLLSLFIFCCSSFFSNFISVPLFCPC